MPRSRSSKTLSTAVLGALALLLAAPSVRADFASGVAAYNEGRWDAALREFRALAELGHVESQFNIGIMHMRGEGVPRSEARGYAWVALAASAGHPKAAEVERELKPVYGADAAGLVADLESRFGLSAVRAQRLPEILPNCEYSTRTPARLSRVTRNLYPEGMQYTGAQGWMVLDFAVAPDGTARDYTILSSNSPDAWRPAAEEAMKEWRWDPALRDGEAVWSRHTVVMRFLVDDAGAFAISRWLGKVKEKADAGDAMHQYLYGIVIAGHPELRKPWSDALPWVEKAAIGGFPLAEYQLGMSLLEGRGCTADRGKALFWLQRAAARGVAEAQHTLAMELLDEPTPVALTASPIDLLRQAAQQDYRSSNMALARLLATGPEVTREGASEAVERSAAALKKNPRDPAALEAHAAALAAAGRFGEAVDHQRKALSLATKRGWALTPLQERLQAYEAGQPWRQPFH